MTIITFLFNDYILELITNPPYKLQVYLAHDINTVFVIMTSEHNWNYRLFTAMVTNITGTNKHRTPLDITEATPQ